MKAKTLIDPSIFMFERQTSVSSTDSTFPVHDSKCDQEEEVDHVDRAQHQRRVKFDLALNQEYSIDTELTAEECEATWYGPHDVSVFKYGFRCSVERLRKVHRISPTHFCTRRLRQCYETFQNASRQEQIVAALEKSAELRIPEWIHGLEKRAVESGNRYSSPKHRLAHAVMSIQRAPHIQDDHERAEMMRQACRSISKPCVFLAFLVAENVALTIRMPRVPGRRHSFRVRV